MAIDLSAITLETALPIVLPAIYFVLLIVVGWFVGHIVGFAITWILRKKPLRLDKRLVDWEVDDAIGHVSLSKIIGKMGKWFVFGMFLSQASSVLSLGVISTVLEQIVYLIPKVIFAILIVLLTLIGADFITDRIRSTKNKMYDVIGIVLEPLIIVFGVILAAAQLGFDLSFLIVMIQDIVRALIWGIAVAFALAVGLGYGLDKKGQPSTVPEKLEKMWKKIH